MGDSTESKEETTEKVEKELKPEENKNKLLNGKPEESKANAEESNLVDNKKADTGNKADDKKEDSVGDKKTDDKEKIREKDNGDNNTETILSSQSLKSSNPSISIPTDSPALSSVKNVKDKPINRNQSDILPSLREIPRDEDPSLMIFSSKGLPTKKYFRRREVNSTILPFGFNDKDKPSTPTTPRVRAEAELTPKINQRVPKQLKMEEEEKEKEAAAKKVPFGDKNPNVPNPSVARNVLTGLGVSSNDEFRSKSARRKDGNPVLGLGYEEPVVASNTGRVPPGGFSNGLW